jgi:hypothetical protein
MPMRLEKVTKARNHCTFAVGFMVGSGISVLAGESLHGSVVVDGVRWGRLKGPQENDKITHKSKLVSERPTSPRSITLRGYKREKQ